MKHPDLIERYIQWCYAKDVPAWHFWDMRSGHIGGAIFAVVVGVPAGLLWAYFS